MSSLRRFWLWVAVGSVCFLLFGPGSAVMAQSFPILGNMNCDAAVDEGDVAPFVLALVNPYGPGGYTETYPTCNVTRANINGDGAIDAADVQAFMGLLFGQAPVGPRMGEYGNSGCLLDSGDEYPWCDDDSFEFTVVGDVLHAIHLSATYNCCPDDIIVGVEVQDGLILLTETEVLTTPCDCMCCFNVESSTVGLSPGVYTVQYCWEDWETGQTQCHEAEIEVESVPEVLSYSNSGCYPEDKFLGLWCPDDDVVEMILDGNQLDITHSNATYNCCPDEIAVSMVVMGSTLIISEEEVLTEPCWCMCCYDVTSTVGGLTPGTYTVQYCWHDEDTGEERCHVEEIVVPVPPPVILSSGDGGCYPGSAAAMDDWGICPGDDEVSVVVAGDRIDVAHVNATYNCCRDDITVAMEVGDHVLLLIEDEIVTEPCWCLCCYDVTTSIGNLASGAWTVTYCWYDEEWAEDRFVELQAEIDG